VGANCSIFAETGASISANGAAENRALSKHLCDKFQRKLSIKIRISVTVNLFSQEVDVSALAFVFS
jgi:hypothetical protein